MAATNPYANPRVDYAQYQGAQFDPEFATQQAAYARPGLSSENGYIDNPASAGVDETARTDTASPYPPSHGGGDTTQWGVSGTGSAASYRIRAQETPSAQRLQTIPLYDSRDPGLNEGIWPLKDADEAKRESVTETRATNFDKDIHISPGDLRWVDNPRRFTSPDPRPTTGDSPSNYKFTRPFDQFNRTHGDDPPTGSARSLTGFHFSMADHRREYDILGMAPQRTGRNTYRLEPTPWDEHVTDLPPSYSQVEGRIQSVDVPGANRSYRL